MTSHLTQLVRTEPVAGLVPAFCRVRRPGRSPLVLLVAAAHEEEGGERRKARVPPTMYVHLALRWSLVSTASLLTSRPLSKLSLPSHREAVACDLWSPRMGPSCGCRAREPVVRDGSWGSSHQGVGPRERRAQGLPHRTHLNRARTRCQPAAPILVQCRRG